MHPVKFLLWIVLAFYPARVIALARCAKGRLPAGRRPFASCIHRVRGYFTNSMSR